MGELVQLEAAMMAVLDMIPEPRRRSPPEAPLHLTQTYARLIVAVGFARLGDHARARALRDECVTALPYDAGDPVHRFLLDAFALRIEETTHAPLDVALDQLQQLMPVYQGITDSFGTNSHYCLSVVHFVESLVLAIIDMRLATLSPRDDVPELAWPYALS